MKRLLAVLLALMLILSPALAAEGTEFSDVGQDDWFAPYVEVCAEEGLLSGTGDGRFRPEGTVSMGEAVVMAARVLWMANGGAGPLPQGGTAEELAEIFYGGAIRSFGKEPYQAAIEHFCAAAEPFSKSYAWDALYYLYAQSTDSQRLSLPDFHRCDPDQRMATRQEFFLAMSFAAQGLEMDSINDVQILPDTASPSILWLYRAGILAGTDDKGTFAAEQFLTRAEAAAVLARVVRPELRLTFSLPVKDVPYTLTPLPLSAEIYHLTQRVADDDAALRYDAQFPGCVLEDLPPLLDVALTEDGGEEKLGLMDWDGAWLLPVEYDEIAPFLTDGLARVKRDGLYGYIDLRGEWVLPCQYPYATTFHDGVVAVGDGAGNLASYDAAGRKLADLPKGVDLSSTMGNCLTYQQDGLWGLLSARGEVLILPQYRALAVEFDGAVVAMDDNGSRGILDTDGTVIVPFLYPRLYNSPDEEGLVVVGSEGDFSSPLHYNGKKGMINGKDQVVMPLQYDYLTPFEGGKAAYLRDGVYGWLSPDGTETPDPQADPFLAPAEPEYPAGDPLAEWLGLTGPHSLRPITEIRNNSAVVEFYGAYYLLRPVVPQ